VVAVKGPTLMKFVATAVQVRCGAAAAGATHETRPRGRRAAGPLVSHKQAVAWAVE